MKNLKKLREDKKISQQKLADAIGTSQQNIHRYENNFYEPDIQTLKQIATFFDTSIDFVVGYTELRLKNEGTKEHDLNEDEAVLIEKYRKLTKDARKSVIVMVDTLLNHISQ